MLTPRLGDDAAKKTVLDDLMSTDEMTALLEKMVLIQSISGHVDKVNRVQRIVARELRKNSLTICTLSTK